MFVFPRIGLFRKARTQYQYSGEPAVAAQNRHQALGPKRREWKRRWRISKAFLGDLPGFSATCQLRHHGFLGRDKPQFLGDISPRCRKLLVAYLQIHRKGSRLERLLQMVFERSSFRSVAVRVFSTRSSRIKRAS